MAKCLNCSKKGFFTIIDVNGLCGDCQMTVLPMLRDKCRIVVESAKIVEKSKNIETIISRADLTISTCNELQVFHEKGIPTLNHAPNAVAIEVRDMASKALRGEVQDAVYNARMARTDGKTDAARLGGYQKAISRLEKLTIVLTDVSLVEETLFGLRVERDNFAIELKLNKADLYIRQGKLKQAQNTLIEAQHALELDATPDELQQALLSRISDTLEKLKVG